MLTCSGLPEITDTPTYLNHKVYTSLFVTDEDLKSKRITPQLWDAKGTTQKALWSITPNFPPDVLSATDKRFHEVNPRSAAVLSCVMCS